MKTFHQLRQELNEAKYPTYAKLSAGALVLKIRSLDSKIQAEDDPVEQNKLISTQNKLISYAITLGIAIDRKEARKR
jgi:hypothetical protein